MNEQYNIQYRQNNFVDGQSYYLKFETKLKVKLLTSENYT